METPKSQLDANRPFKVEKSPDSMRVFIPAKSTVAEEALTWDDLKFESHLKEQGYTGKFTTGVSKLLKAAFESKKSRTLREDVVLLQGIPPTNASEGLLVWLSSDDWPQGLVNKGETFLKIVQPQPAQAGTDVLGKPITPMGLNMYPPISIFLPPELRIVDDSFVEAMKPGYVIIEAFTLHFATEYVVPDPTDPKLRQIEFPCSIRVKGDLAGPMSWVIRGDLHVEGHWSAPDITVHGNALVASGIHTNMQGTTKIFGNLEANYVQLSRIGIAKNANIRHSIVQSEIRVGGNLTCTGTPGAAMGSKIDCFGTLKISRVESAGKTPSTVVLHNAEKAKASRIGTLFEGCSVKVESEVWMFKESAQWDIKSEKS
jgi:uncharacterized protein (DUF342 family)